MQTFSSKRCYYIQLTELSPIAAFKLILTLMAFSESVKTNKQSYHFKCFKTVSVQNKNKQEKSPHFSNHSIILVKNGYLYFY